MAPEESRETAKRWRRREKQPEEVHAEAEVDLGHEDQQRPQLQERPKEATTLRDGRHKPLEPCPICMEGFTSDGMPRTCRKCSNSFHQACLSEWAKKEQQIKWEQKPWMLPSQFESGSCPCCRSSKGHDRSRRWKK
ncbi:unnamed protein product [Effrenium voratum]|uniref:RING-type domain-containing protein n=1 Tax=Effrenium voratum TaxID=2562239 RepID=A0AA36JRM3_9DINO|nr:unnamed protein product [Effrenium voratum]